ncbi:MAG: transcriptional regulator GcvA [Alsobacter sp.]
MSALPPLAAVRVFEAAARHQSFTRAAQELGMTQAAVSYQIKVLEERVGQPLFLRSKGRVTLSDAGERLAEPVREAFGRLRDAFSSVREEASGTLSISTVQTFATHWLVPRLGSFRQERPHLAVRLETQSRLVDFASEDIDVAIRSGLGDWPGLSAHLLMRTTFTPMLAPSLMDRLGRPESPAELARFPLIGVTDPWWRSWFRLAGVPDPALAGQADVRLGSQQLEASAALAGQGVAILTPAFFREDLATGRLVQPFDLEGDDGHSYWLVYPEARRLVPKIQAFRDWASRQVESGGKH